MRITLDIDDDVQRAANLGPSGARRPRPSARRRRPHGARELAEARRLFAEMGVTGWDHDARSIEE